MGYFLAAGGDEASDGTKKKIGKCMVVWEGNKRLGPTLSGLVFIQTGCERMMSLR